MVATEAATWLPCKRIDPAINDSFATERLWDP